MASLRCSASFLRALSAAVLICLAIAASALGSRLLVAVEGLKKTIKQEGERGGDQRQPARSLSRKRNLSLTSMRAAARMGVFDERLAGFGVALGVGERDAAGDALAEVEAAVDFDRGIERGAARDQRPDGGGGEAGGDRGDEAEHVPACGQVGDRDDARQGDRDRGDDECGEQAPRPRGPGIARAPSVGGRGRFGGAVRSWTGS